MSVSIITVDTVPKDQKVVLLFWAPWHEDSVRLKETVLPALASITSSSSSSNTNADCIIGSVHAEDEPDLSERFGVEAVPTFVFLGSNGKAIETMEGIVEVASVTQAVQRLLQQPDEVQQDGSVVGDVNPVTTTSLSVPVVPSLPVDTTVSTSTTSTLAPLPPPPQDNNTQEPPQDKLQRLTTSAEVVLFMKGSPDTPRCGFSRQAVELLQTESIVFDTFDILSDESVRQGLKDFSDWPTFPQLYVRGDFVGGLDILKEMKEESDNKSLREALEVESLNDRLAKLVKRDRIMLFMKGLPSAPKCGFSRQIVELLEDEGVAFDSFNILEDNDVRQGLKEFSDWPTFPQLYVDGDLVGGLDIVKEMKESGELTEFLKG